MSRLDSFIRRMQAQRSCLNFAAAGIAEIEGPVLELGLGNGRTYDHLRERLPEREIFVFERRVAAHPDCIPDSSHLLLGEIYDTLPAAAERFAGEIALVHTDMGSGDEDANRELSAFIAVHLPKLLRVGGLVIADRDVAFTGAQNVPPPEDVQAGRYFIYRAS